MHLNNKNTMRIFSWVQLQKKVINGGYDSKRKYPISDYSQKIGNSEDWPQSLLAIGTFGGNNQVKFESNLFLQEQVITESETELENSDDQDRTYHSTVVSAKGGKDIRFDKNAKKGIGKKSFSFFVKKLSFCKSGFSPTSNLRDQIAESKMDKMFRAMLHKKIYPQSFNPAVSNKKKYISNGCAENSDNEEEENEKTDRGYKWVKTDSEYIVLEI